MKKNSSWCYKSVDDVHCGLCDMKSVKNGKTNLIRTDARIMEQNLINQYGLPNLSNQINSIAPRNWLIFGVKP